MFESTIQNELATEVYYVAIKKNGNLIDLVAGAFISHDEAADWIEKVSPLTGACTYVCVEQKITVVECI